MAGKPYMPFYVGDWLKDPAVSLCAPATRGVWMDLLCAMHEASRSGELSGTRDQLARLGRCSTADLALALTDLQTTGAADVTERNGVVTIVNRRMARERKARDDTALRVGRHRMKRRCNAPYSSSLSSSTSNSPSVSEEEPPKPPAGRSRKSRQPTEAAILIYDAYPKKVGRPKALEKIMLALDRVPFDELLAATKAYADAQHGNPEPQYIPHPATWFQNDRWADDRSTWTAWKTKGSKHGRTPLGPGQQYDPNHVPEF